MEKYQNQGFKRPESEGITRDWPLVFVCPCYFESSPFRTVWPLIKQRCERINAHGRVYINCGRQKKCFWLCLINLYSRAYFTPERN